MPAARQNRTGQFHPPAPVPLKAAPPATLSPPKPLSCFPSCHFCLFQSVIEVDAHSIQPFVSGVFHLAGCTHAVGVSEQAFPGDCLHELLCLYPFPPLGAHLSAPSLLMTSVRIQLFPVNESSQFAW